MMTALVDYLRAFMFSINGVGLFIPILMLINACAMLV